MSLDLRNFIQVNINYHTSAVSAVDSGVVTLITKNSVYSADPYKGQIFYSKSQYDKAHAGAGQAIAADTSLDKYVQSFFHNHGKALQIIGGYSGAEVDADIATWIKTIVKALNYKYVIIVSDCSIAALELVAQDESETTTILNPLTSEDAVPSLAGLNEKIYISSSNNVQYETSLPEEIQNFIIKIGQKGCEMLAAAFLSQVRIDNGNTISDYNFTIENVNDFSNEGVSPADPIIVDDNDTAVTLIDANFNFDSTLVNAVRNIGGNTVHGADIMNYYVRILLTQSLTEKILNVLVSKIKLNQSGINRVQNAIQIEMNKYINNGYLNPEFIWTEDDLYFNWNNQSYLICSRNEPLVKGYKSVILPVSALSYEQKEAHAFPPVFLLLADQSGVRFILINGDVY